MPMDGDLNFKLLPPPNRLPKFSESEARDVSYFGQTNYADGTYQSSVAFGIKRIDRRRHMYVIGKSGMGKTCLLEMLIRYDLSFGYGVAVIDPHGDLAKHVLAAVPQNRIDEVVYIDPSDLEYPIAFNPFANVPKALRQSVAQGLVEIFEKQFASTWTPRIEHLFRFACLATLENPEGTLYGLLQLIVDSRYRQWVIKHIDDEVVKRFFSVEFAGYSQKYDQEAITPLANRLGQFFADPLMRGIFTQKENKIDFQDIMEEGKILIVNCSKGILGEENSALFGSFFLTKINQVAMARARQEEEERREFYLYVDEFQNVATHTFISLFSESRKYGINITVANQYLGQIGEKLREAILGNVGTILSFRLGGADADRMVQEFRPLVQSQDIINLGMRDFYIKMAIDGRTAQPFSAVTLPLQTIHIQPDALQEILDLGRERYARSPDEAGVSLTFEERETEEERPKIISEDLPPV